MEIPWQVQAVVNDAVDKRHEGAHGQKIGILTELACSYFAGEQTFREKMIQTESAADRQQLALRLLSDDYKAFWELIEEPLRYAEDSINAQDRAGKQWWPSEIKDLSDPKLDTSAELTSLAFSAMTYCRRSTLNSPLLEQWLLQKMIFAETFAFGREAGLPLRAKSFKTWWLIAVSTFKWVVGVAVALSIGEQHGFAVGLLTYVAWIALIRYTMSDKVEQTTRNAKAFLAMRTAYMVALRNTVSPVELEKALQYAEAAGAVWPSGTYSLLEKAKQRSLMVWTKQ